MIKFSKRVFVLAPIDEVFCYCSSLEGFRQQFPFAIKWLNGPTHWSCNDLLEFKYRIAGIWLPHHAKIVDFKKGEYFVDKMTRGIYQHFHHTHRFTSEPKGTWVNDEVEFSFGFGGLVDKLIGLPTLNSTFKKRHEALQKHFNKVIINES